GGGTKRPLDQPRWTASSQNSASPTGSTSPSAGRANRASRPPDGCTSVGARSTVAAMLTGDTAHPSNATATTEKPPPRGASQASLEGRGPDRGRSSFEGRARARPPQDDGLSFVTALVRHHVAVVDQLVDRLLDVDVGLDHAGLLQRHAGFQDRV